MTKRREDKRNCRKERRKSNIKWGERRCIERKWKRNPFLENANTVKHTFDVKYLRWQQSQTNPPPSSLSPYHLLLTLLTAAWSNPINKDRVNINPDIRVIQNIRIMTKVSFHLIIIIFLICWEVQEVGVIKNLPRMNYIPYIFFYVEGERRYYSEIRWQGWLRFYSGIGWEGWSRFRFSRWFWVNTCSNMVGSKSKQMSKILK